MVGSRSKTAAEAVSTRRTTRAGALKSPVVAVGAPAPAPAPAPESKPTPLSAIKKAQQTKNVAAVVVATAKTPEAPTPLSAGVKRMRKRGTYCVCEGTDDGTPMIKCEGPCKNWYHFRCVDLLEENAGEIEKYYCPNCEAATGLKTVMDYEGAHALMEVAPTPVPQASLLFKLPTEEPPEIESPEDSGDDGSEDDYIAERSHKKRPARHLSFSSDKTPTDGDDENDESEGEGGGGARKRYARGGEQRRLKRLKKGSLPSTPAPAHAAAGSAPKRRPSTAAHVQGGGQEKRARTGESPAGDATRQYVLTQLDSIIRSIFEKHALQVEEVPKAEEEAHAEDVAAPAPSERKEKVLSDGEKASLDVKVKTFVTELERCMMETYAEPDKSGKPGTGIKYKERFRMLQFNVPQKNRTQLHRGIASGRITPAQLNVMSSTDLADEQTKHDIEAANKESLEQSILQKISAPRAKITHKGFEDIEDLSGARAAADRDENEQRMAQEKRERERMARLRNVATQQQQGGEGSPTTPVDAAFGPNAVPPSPATRANPSWGAPPPVPGGALQTEQGAATMSIRPQPRPLFNPSASDFASVDQGLDLADLIHIDDDMPPQDVPPTSNPQERMNEQLTAGSAASAVSPVITSGPSPFAQAKPAESPRRMSFDLNALWTAPGQSEPPKDGAEHIVESPIAVASPSEEPRAKDVDEAMDLGSDNDQDLDAMLDRAEQGAEQEFEQADKPSAPVDFNALPRVWDGQLCMPLEVSNTLAPDVDCRQIGGQDLAVMSGYWQTLFPSSSARIDGRVPTNTSTQYLVATRLNPVKELIAVCFTPRSEQAKADYTSLIQYLTGKDRHALVFPWGVHPKPQAPGRELYIIPLLKDSPIPEFIELLDDHRLPKERDSDILLGVFVLNKGKLTPSALPALPAPPQPVASTSASTSTSTVPAFPYDTAVTASAAPPASIGVSVESLLSSLPGVLAATLKPPAPANAARPVKIDQAALEQECASLTPEQRSTLADVIKLLNQSAPVAATGSIPPMPPVPAMLPTNYPLPPMPNFPPQFLPTFPPQPQPASTAHYSPPNPQDQGYPNPVHDNRGLEGQSYGREEQGRRGRPGRPRGRPRNGGRGGRPSNNDGDARDVQARPGDRGWVGRGRGRGRGRKPYSPS